VNGQTAICQRAAVSARNVAAAMCIAILGFAAAQPLSNAGPVRFVHICSETCPLGMVASATATLTKAVRVVIEIQHSGASSSFGLTTRRRLSGGLSDRGRARRVVAQTVGDRDGGLRYLAGYEQLRGTRGTLILRWSGKQRLRRRQRGRLSGRWSLVSGTATYAGYSGRGRFVSDGAAGRFVGLLITAE